MDNTRRVGNISASASIGTMNSRDGSRSSTVDSYTVGNIGDTIANNMEDRGSIADSMVDRGSISNMSNSMPITNTSIAKVATITIGTIESISFSFCSSKGYRANLKDERSNVEDDVSVQLTRRAIFIMLYLCLTRLE